MYDHLERTLKLEPGTVSYLLTLDPEACYRQGRVRRRRSMLLTRDTQIKWRDIWIPSDDLKKAQKAIHRLLSTRYHASNIAHGYVNKRSNITNARCHLGSKVIEKVDFENFYGSLHILDVIDSLQYALYDFKEADIYAVANICCFRGVLPQGSPASPVLSNMICELFDGELEKMVRTFGCIVTRLSDDLTISTKSTRLPLELGRISFSKGEKRVEVGNSLSSLIADFGYRINNDKLRIQSYPGRLSVTGCLLTDRLDVPVELRRNLRAALHQWEIRGAEELDFASYGQPSIKNFVKSLKGSIDYLGQVRGKDDALHQRFSALFEGLVVRDDAQLSGWRNCN